MIFFTSDTHFGHDAVISYSNRPFKDAAEMEEVLVARWNAVVSPKDVVHHLGDFAFLKTPDVERILDRLNGEKHLVPGNHDSNHVTRAEGWASVAGGTPAGKEVRVIPGMPRVICTHYALRTWRKVHHGSLHLFGHSHGNMPGSRQCLDVGVDCWNYTPVTFDQITARMATLPRYTSEDHHKPVPDSFPDGPEEPCP